MASAESEIEGSHFLAGFRALATSADPQTRENCAAGFAAVLRTATARRSHFFHVASSVATSLHVHYKHFIQVLLAPLLV